MAPFIFFMKFLFALQLTVQLKKAPCLFFLFFTDILYFQRLIVIQQTKV